MQVTRFLASLETIFLKRGLSIAGTAGERGILSIRGWIRRLARMEAQKLELWALQPSRRAKHSKWLDLAAARREETIALAAIEMPRFSRIVSTPTKGHEQVAQLLGLNPLDLEL